jgi:hypothetical protein
MRRSGSMSGQSRLRSSVRLAATAAFVTLGFAAIAGRPAHAGDNKWYPGSLCQKMDASSDVFATNFNRIFNSSTTLNRLVSCPLVRDNTGNTNGSPGQAWVYVSNNTAGVTFECTFYSTAGDTGSVIAQNTASTTLSGNVRLSIPVTSSASSGPYGVRCTIPPLSSIISYQMPEYTPTD